MHHAVDQLDLATIFPTPCDGNTMNERSSTVMECLKELKRSELNQSQQEAITSMLDPACTRVSGVIYSSNQVCGLIIPFYKASSKLS